MERPRRQAAAANRWVALPQLEAVRVFAAVAEFLSFREAALALGLPRSTVSRHIGLLESALGARLLQRTTRRVSLTNAGELFFAEVTPALQSIGDAGRRLLDAQGEPRGLLRLSATPSAAERVGALMLDFVEQNPHVRVDLDFSDRQIDLVAEGFDLAIRTGRLADSTLVARQVGEGASGYYASAQYVRSRPRLLRPAQLTGHDCIVFTGSSRGGRWAFVVGKRAQSVAVHGRIVTSSLAVAKLAVLRHHGISWLPEPLARAEVRAGRLIPVLTKFWPASTPIQIVYPSARHLAPQVRAAIEFLAKKLPEAL